MSKEPLDLDKHRGMAAQKATDLRRTLAEVETHAKELRDRQTALENQLLSLPAETWQEAAAKARYVLNLCRRPPARRQPPSDSRCDHLRRFCAAHPRGLNEFARLLYAIGC